MKYYKEIVLKERLFKKFKAILLNNTMAVILKAFSHISLVE
jgi:hypothetical protein